MFIYKTVQKVRWRQGCGTGNGQARYNQNIKLSRISHEEPLKCEVKSKEGNKSTGNIIKNIKNQSAIVE